MSTHRELAARIESIVDELDELIFDRLQEATASGATRRPDDERELTRARRALDRAATVLRRLDGDG